MRWRKLLPLLGLGLFAYLVWKTGLGQIWRAVGQMDWRYLAILPIPLIAMFIVQTLKWDLLLRGQSIRIGFLDLLRMHMAGFFYALLTPGRVGYLMKISFLRDQTERSWGECSSSVIVDRFLDMIILLCFAAIGSLILINQGSQLLLYISIVTGALLAGLAFFSSHGRARFLLDLIFGLPVLQRFRERGERTLNAFYNGLPSIQNVFIPLILTVVNWVLIYSQPYIVARSLHIQVDYLSFIFVVAIGTIVGLIPVTISGLGTREATLVALLGIYSVSPEQTVAMSLIALVLCSYLPALIGYALSFGTSKQIASKEIVGGKVH